MKVEPGHIVLTRAKNGEPMATMNKALMFFLLIGAIIGGAFIVWFFIL